MSSSSSADRPSSGRRGVRARSTAGALVRVLALADWRTGGRVRRRPAAGPRLASPPMTSRRSAPAPAAHRPSMLHASAPALGAAALTFILDAQQIPPSSPHLPLSIDAPSSRVLN